MATFFGLPLPGTLRMASRADSGYIDSFVNGFIFATNNLCKTAFFSMPSSCAISLIVIPVIVFIKKLSEKSKKILDLLNICKAEYEIFSKKLNISLDLC